MKVVNHVVPGTEQLAAFFATDDGPFVMINLLKFRDNAATSGPSL